MLQRIFSNMSESVFVLYSGTGISRFFVTDTNTYRNNLNVFANGARKIHSEKYNFLDLLPLVTTKKKYVLNFD